MQPGSKVTALTPQSDQFPIQISSCLAAQGLPSDTCRLPFPACLPDMKQQNSIFYIGKYEGKAKRWGFLLSQRCLSGWGLESKCRGVMKLIGVSLQTGGLCGRCRVGRCLQVCRSSRELRGCQCFMRLGDSWPEGRE